MLTNNANKQHLSLLNQIEIGEKDILFCNCKINAGLMHLIQLTLPKLDVKVQLLYLLVAAVDM